MIDGLETAFYLGCILTETIYQNNRENVMPIESLIDNKSLFDSIHSMKLTNDKRLRVDLATIKEMMEKKELCKVQWIPTSHQLSDCLTKKGHPQGNFLKSSPLENFTIKQEFVLLTMILFAFTYTTA